MPTSPGVASLKIQVADGSEMDTERAKQTEAAEGLLTAGASQGDGTHFSKLLPEVTSSFGRDIWTSLLSWTLLQRAGPRKQVTSRLLGTRAQDAAPAGPSPSGGSTPWRHSRKGAPWGHGLWGEPMSGWWVWSGHSLRTPGQCSKGFKLHGQKLRSFFLNLKRSSDSYDTCRLLPSVLP